MKLKNLLKMVVSTVAAAALLASVPTFAAVPAADPTVAVVIGETYDVSTSGLFSKQDAGTDQVSSDGRFIANCKIDSAGLNLKSSDGYGAKFLTPATECKVSITEDNSKDATLSWTDNGSAETATITGGTTTTVKLPANTVCTLVGATTSSSKIKTIEVKTAEEPTAYYTLSGTVTVDGVATSDVELTLTGSDYVTSSTATTDSAGAYSFTNIGNIETVSISVAGTDNYSGAEYEDISMASGNVTYNISLVAKKNITTSAFLNASDLDYSNGAVINDGNTLGNGYFTVVGSMGFQTTAMSSYGNLDYSKRINTQNSGSTTDKAIKFTTEAPAYVQIVFVTGTNGNERGCVLSDGTNTVTATNDDTSAPTALNTYLNAAGTYYIYGNASIRIGSINVVCNATVTDPTSTGYAAAYENGTTVYSISTVSDTTVNSVDSLTIKTDKTDITTTDTVYDYVSVDNFVFTASDFSTDAYVYTIAITGAPDTSVYAASVASGIYAE